MRFKIFTANCSGNAGNCDYPNKVEVSSAQALQDAVKKDHVGAAYKNNYRNTDNFISSDVIIMDVDNDHTDNPEEFITADTMDELFPDTDYCLVPSRHHMQPKGKRPAAPRFHVMFPIPGITDADTYAGMKEALAKKYPFFDKNALDAARFLYGCNVTEVVWHEGWLAKVTWADEIRKWDNLSHLRYSIAVGTEKERLEALQADADIYIINRENVQWLVEKSKTPFEFDMVVIDELSSFKNWNSKRFKAFMQVRPRVKRIVGLTGTPSPNGMMDLFAQFKCLDMGARLGRFITQYRNAYFVPDRMNGQIVYSYALRPEAEEQIYDKIADITISMKALDYLQMPELVETRYPVYMDEKEDAQYEQLKTDMILAYKEDDDITAANAAALSGKLCQMANGAVYSESGEAVHIHDRKLDALEDIIEAANGKPVLVAYWFKHDLERICKRLDALKIEYARISSPGSIEMWNKGEFAVGLIHPAAAGHGLNLQSGGSHIVWFGLTWSLELYQQTNARLWRQGQKNKTVVVQHIVTAGTIDEDILDALTCKDASQKRLINAVKAHL